MFASSQSLGSCPLESDWVKMAARYGASVVAVSFRIRFGSSSGPEAFVGLICQSSFSTPKLVICSPGSVGSGLPCSVGMLAVSSHVKTD